MLVDSGATHSLINPDTAARIPGTAPTEESLNIRHPDGSSMHATQATTLHHTDSLPIHTFITPGVTTNLLAVADLTNHGVSVNFSPDAILLHDGATVHASGSRDPANGLWHLPLAPAPLRGTTEPPNPGRSS
mmetsp:Transcript_17703/g.44958  ORF Transcript_17703/g.44958 Transcript_17703/m.44958 type:complete len:132 (-) Transcript_17703:26-421(-)